MQAWLVDGILGSSMALVAITAAQAALPMRPMTLAPGAPATQRAAQTVVQPATPPVLIAFADPLPGAEIDSPFGLRQLPWEGAGRLHAGIDLLAPAGAHVLAAAGLTTRYAHMARFETAVTAGLAVKAGTPIGFVGSTGSSTGAHLHFEIRDHDDRPLNPEMFLGQSFASSADLPLKEALRPAHGGVRLAYVSNIPASKRAQMEALLHPAVRHIDPAVQRRIDAETARRVAASFGETAEDAAATASNPRPHMRLHPTASPEAAASVGALPAG
jgi:hypothetical protein